MGKAWAAVGWGMPLLCSFSLLGLGKRENRKQTWPKRFRPYWLQLGSTAECCSQVPRCSFHHGLWGHMLHPFPRGYGKERACTALRVWVVPSFLALEGNRGTDSAHSGIPHFDLGFLLALLSRQGLPGEKQETLLRTHDNYVLFSFSWTLTHSTNREIF